MYKKTAEILFTISVGVAALTGTASAQNSPGSLALDASLRGAVERKDVPGVVALVTDRDKVLYQSAFGVADVATGRPLTADALFRIASMTKAITSVALMQLIEQGRLGLDDPAEKYLPELVGLKVIESFDKATGAYQVRPVSRPPTVNTSSHVRMAYPFTSESGAISSRAPAKPIRCGPLLFDGLRRHATAEKRHQRPAQRVRPLRREYHLRSGLVAFRTRRPEQVGHAPGDGGRGIDPVDRPRREPCQPVEQQRIVGAGQHDGVGAAVPSPTKQGASSAAISASRTSLPLRSDSAKRGELAPSQPASPRSPARNRRSGAWVYSRLTVPLVPSTETRLVFELAQAGLIAGTVPTNGTLVGAAQVGHHKRGRGVAGDHHQNGRMARDQLAGQRHHAGDDLLLAVVAVGKERVVRDIDVVRVGPRAARSRAGPSGRQGRSRRRGWWAGLTRCDVSRSAVTVQLLEGAGGFSGVRRRM